jgi:hypothetical protein
MSRGLSDYKTAVRTPEKAQHHTIAPLQHHRLFARKDIHNILSITAMKLSIVLSALTAGVALAAPVSDVEKRATTGVYLCNDRGFTGYCQHITAPSGTCVPLASDLNDKVSSAGPDVGSFCYFFV